MVILPTREIKPSQRCPKCGAVHKEWAELSNRHHACPDCGFEIPRDSGSALGDVQCCDQSTTGVRN
ncbi:zinc ribbon domain-containing protein [Scytonema sp. HK-05]|uniref:zinc ribbon domain-containing protein n=1 Tax=Scytonema sp. HK-05 TaxID=1137095 RepID=UPI000936AAD6|nr:hypothetical protein NIES2130_39330 [Scytonema sp. HK-05]